MRALGVLATVLLLAAGSVRGQEATPASDPWEAAAKKLSQATVTVRILTAKGGSAADGAEKEPAQSPQAVTVCSGVLVREGQVVTAAMAGSDSQIRLTLAGGKQAEARLQVIDEFSGLALLKCDTAPPELMELAADVPAVGASVMTASGWGIEQPLVSLGIVAGKERQRPGAMYPPLIQCDLRTTDTSSGAGLIDRRGRLVGVIVAADSPESRRGWAYAVPISHVERLLRTAEAQKAAGVTVLKRRRPVAGLRLDQVNEAIVVARVDAGGAAERAGIQVGDVVLATDGVAIRSVYQATLPTLYKQPGDTLTFRVRRDSGDRDIQVVLGGGVELASAPLEMLTGFIQPKIQVTREGTGYIARRPGSMVQEVFQPPLSAEEQSPATATTTAATAADKIALLERALDRYRAVIEYQQRQLTAEQNRRAAQDELLKSLRAELEELRRQLENK